MKEKRSNKFLLLWYSHPRIAIAFVLVGINLLVILLFTIILALISGNDFLGELSYLFTYTMCSDGIYDFVNNQDDLACFVVKIILTVIQMVIFSGALIGFATDILQNTFDKRLENKDKLMLKNHYVFLNWSPIGQNIIYDLSFLEGEKTIVILADVERETIINSIDNIFTASGKKKTGLRIFVKKGDPNSSKHLADISIAEAKHVGILSADKENVSEKEVSTNDLEAFKLLLSMIGLAPKANFVVETENELAKEKIEHLIASTHPDIMHKVSVFSHNAVMGYILGKTVINPMYSALYHHVLSFEGVEFYGIPPMDIEQALYKYNDCIPIVNYDDDDEVDEQGNKSEDRLYILSDTKDSLGERPRETSFVKPLVYEENIQTEEFTLFVFSASNRVDFVISELTVYNEVYHANIRHRIFSYASDLYENMEIIAATPGKKKILLLSDESTVADNQDSEVFMSLLELKANPAISNHAEIFVEIINLDNLTAVRNLDIASVILSNRIISLYMLQLLTHGESRKFFRDVLVADAEEGGIDFEIITADNLLQMPKEGISFACYSEMVQSFYMAAGRNKMLVGYIPATSPEEICFLCDKMDEQRALLLQPKDQLVRIVYR